MAQHCASRLSAVAGILMVFCLPTPSVWATTVHLQDSYISPDGKELGLTFDGNQGLSGQAIFTLFDSRTIDILLTNTSTAIPSGVRFDNPSDQILTSLYFDLGARGLNAADPRIIGGSAAVAADSYGVGGATLQPGADLSHLWGYANYKYGDDAPPYPPPNPLPPNIVTTMVAHAKAFSGNDKGLKGPNYGAISALDLAGGHEAGLPSVSDTVYIRVSLDKDLTTGLECISDPGNYVPYIEFGSDYRFFVADGPPPPPIPEPVTIAGVLLACGCLGGYLRKRR